MTGQQPEGLRKPGLLVLASTYPRWPGDHEPGFVHELCKRLAAWFDVTVVAPDAPDADPDGPMDGVHVVRFRYAPRRWQTLVNDGGMLANLRANPLKWMLVPAFLAGMLVATAGLLRRRRFSVVQAHWIIPQGLVAVLASGFARRTPRLVLTAHGADLFAFRGNVFRHAKRLVARRAAAVTVVSEAMREEALALGISPEKLLVRPMGVDLSAFSPEPGLGRARDELLFVGRLVEKKGLCHLLDAMPAIVAAVPGTRLTIAGFGPQLASLRAQAERLGLDACVRFAGAVPQSALPGMYRHATGLVAPFVVASDGDREGLGLVMVEALGCGCPVVTTRIGAVRDVFGGDWPRHCAEPGDPVSLAREVIALLREPAAAFEAAAAAGPALRQRFDWPSVAAGYATLLAEVAGHEA